MGGVFIDMEAKPNAATTIKMTMIGSTLRTEGWRTMSRIMPIGSVNAELPTGRGTMALLLVRGALSESVVVTALLLRPTGELSVALAVAMVFS
jgi:hypothetical protein